ncbi:hypothetical protein B0H13DRAFT_2340460 [Mycena leptocephala]|nr:hypothetical protein B0H13DRAFT_2340460 [Mycena leptocephala]
MLLRTSEPRSVSVFIDVRASAPSCTAYEYRLPTRGSTLDTLTGALSLIIVYNPARRAAPPPRSLLNFSTSLSHVLTLMARSGGASHPTRRPPPPHPPFAPWPPSYAALDTVQQLSEVLTFTNCLLYDYGIKTTSAVPPLDQPAGRDSIPRRSKFGAIGSLGTAVLGKRWRRGALRVSV